MKRLMGKFRPGSSISGLFIALAIFGIGLLQISPAGADPLAQWQWKNPLPQGNALNSLTYGMSNFVAVGAAGTIVTSIDGTSWTARRPNANSNDLKGIAYGSKKFVAIGASGTILNSPDGSIWTDVSASIKWKSSTALPRPALNGITFGNNLFYAVGDNGTLLSSGDGVSWVEKSDSTLTSKNLNAVSYSNYAFVAVGANGTVVTLLNSGAWQAATSGTANTLNSIASDRNRFVAVGAAGTIATSTDGINWELQLSGTAGTLLGISAGATGAGVSSFVAAGLAGTLLTSPDGVVWTATASGTTRNLYGCGSGNSRFVVLGDGGTILTSANPTVAWTAHLNGPVASLKSIAYGGGAYVAVGPGGETVSSLDGSSWSSTDSGTTADINHVAYGNGSFVAVGDGGLLLNSFDGTIWVRYYSGTSDLNGVVFDSRPGYSRFIAVGDAGVVVTSPNGMIWTALSPSPTAKNLKAVALGDNLLVAVGDGGTVLTSPDGATWTARTGITKDLTGVTVAFTPSGDTAYVTVGAGGSIYSSPDTLKWSAAKSVPAAYKTTDFSAISSDFDSTFSTFVVVGSGGGILSSSDALTWSAKKAPTSYDLAGISYLNKSYWVVSDDGIILNSNRLDNYISVSATRGESGVSLSTEQLDLGYVDVDKVSFPVSLKIANTGQTSNLQVAAPVIGGVNAAEFSAASSSCGNYPLTIAPGGDCTFNLTFAPGSAGAKSATITVTSDDSATPVLNIPVSATGGLYVIVQPGPNGGVRAGSSAGAAVSGPMRVLVGDTPSFFMSATSPYYTQEVVVNDVTLGAPPSYNFPAITATGIPHTLQAYFSNAAHTITASASLGGSVYPAGVQSVLHGATQAFTITPSIGYHLESFKVDGASAPLTSLYLFPRVNSNHTVHATFAVDSFTMAASVVTNGVVSGAGGTITQGGNLPIGSCSFTGGSGICDYGSTVTYTITPKPGYTLVNVLVDNASLGAINSYNFPAPLAADHTIQAVFTNLVDITVSLGPTTPPNGSISPVPDSSTGKVSVQKGKSQSFAITPAEGHVIADVKVDGASLGPVSSYTFVNVQVARTLDVSFAAKKHVINVSAGLNGDITDELGNIISAQVLVANHATKVFRIVPDANYEVADVKVDGVSVAAVGSHVFTDVVAGHTIEALFRGKPWVVVVSSAGPATPKIGSIAFNATIPAGVTLPLNPDANSPLGEVDPAVVTTLSGAAGGIFGVSLWPALDITTALPIALGTAQVSMANGPGFTAGGDILKLGFTTALDPAPSFVLGAPTAVTDVNGAAVVGVTVSAADPVALPVTTANYPGGLYNAPLSVALTVVPAGADIHYTTSAAGKEPTTLSTIYKSDHSVPISITADTVLKFFARDRATGNIGPVKTERYVIDKTAPTGLWAATLIGVPPALTKETGAVMTIVGRDVVSYKYILDSADKLTQGSSATESPVSTPITLAGLSDGTHQLQVIGKDSAGNWQSAATVASWTVDTTLPATGISPTPGLYNAPLSVTLSNSKSSSAVYYTLDGITEPTRDSLLYTAPIPITGTTTVRFRAFDPAGNEEPEGDPAVYTLLTLSVNPPLSPSVDPNPTLSGTFYPTDADVSIMIKKGIVLDPVPKIPGKVGRNWSYGVTGLTPGLNTMTVTVSHGGKTLSQTVYVRVDATPCVVADGDIDRDGQIAMADVEMAMRMSIGLLTQAPLSTALLCGDVFPVGADGVPVGDGIVNVIDTLSILRKMMGLSSYLP